VAVIQKPFFIPTDFVGGMMSEKFKKVGVAVGNAVRTKTGQPIKYLRPIDYDIAERLRHLGTEALVFTKRNEGKLFLAGLGMGLVALGSGLYIRIKNLEMAALKRYKSLLKRYIVKIRKGKLDLKTIELVNRAADKIIGHEKYDTFIKHLKSEEYDELVNRMEEYTIELAELNSIELTEEEKNIKNLPDELLLKFRALILTQKRIFQAGEGELKF